MLLGGCAVSNDLALPMMAEPAAEDGRWRVSHADLFLSAQGPQDAGATFHIPDRDARGVVIALNAVSETALQVDLDCDGPAALRGKGSRDEPLAAKTARRVNIGRLNVGNAALVWQPESGTCRIRPVGGQELLLIPETAALPRLNALARHPINCRITQRPGLDPLQAVFLGHEEMLQSCPMPAGRMRSFPDPLDAMNARIEALTGRTVPRAWLEAGDPDMPLDFSRAPKLDLIQVSYLHIRADFVGYLTSRMLAFHARRGTQVRIMVSDVLMLRDDRLFYESLASRYPNIQLQYFRWRFPGAGDFRNTVDYNHRVQHTRSFLTLSPTPGRSRYIFGGRNLHDGFFFSSPIDLTHKPYLHTYDEGRFQDLGFYSVYEDLEVELRDDAAVRAIAAQNMALWNRDAISQAVKGPLDQAPARTSGMRHYLSLPWLDDEAQVDWFVAAIEAAQHEVLIVTPYLNPMPAIQAAMERAIARGVPVRLIARIESTDPAGFIITALNRAYVARNAGKFEIYEYFPRPKMMHTKMMVIDRRLAVTTSTNLDQRAFIHDTENGLIFLDTPQVGQLMDVVRSYEPKLRRLTPDEPLHPLSNFVHSWPWLRSVF
ncbi:MAG: phosphatidylserine/phosphatidylglycerophosphate/cardiolipin synthase family protein [Paracoccaceae bacterium]|nr:phosphatidylserine/phosphatidylglycerophosphate/cardiolipin synthase family protein [Paracoccaceae bacterium]